MFTFVTSFRFFPFVFFHSRLIDSDCWHMKSSRLCTRLDDRFLVVPLLRMNIRPKQHLFEIKFNFQYQRIFVNRKWGEILTDQIPASTFLMHQWSTTVALAWIFSATTISSAHHFRINDNIDAIRSMPSLADSAIKSIHYELKIGSNEKQWISIDKTHLFSMTGTSTACSVFGRSLEPGFNAPQPAAHPNLPRKSSFFSGRQIGAKNENQTT